MSAVANADVAGWDGEALRKIRPDVQLRSHHLFYDLIPQCNAAQGWIHVAIITTPERVRMLFRAVAGIAWTVAVN
jgi:hypothetical protein